MDLSWWQILLGVFVGLFLLMILVVLHELGHAISAVKNGVEVEEFGLGFPPRAKILGKVGKTLVTLNWLLPLGGFCKLKGESDSARARGSFGAASFWVKTKILFAGVLMNLLTAMAIFTVLAWIGLPKAVSGQFALSVDNFGKSGKIVVANVAENSPAAKIGLKNGDEIVAFQGKKVELSSELPNLTRINAGKKVEVSVRRDGEIITKTAQLNSDKKAQQTGAGYFGISTQQSESPTIRATWSAPAVGVINTLQFVGLTFSGLADLVVNLSQGIGGIFLGDSGASAQLSAVGDSVAGPVGILGVIFPSALEQGAIQLFFLMGIISLTLTVMNILPIPGLDGGRWFLIAIYKLRKKPLTKEKEETIVSYGILFLFGLIIVITIADILKIF